LTVDNVEFYTPSTYKPSRLAVGEMDTMAVRREFAKSVGFLCEDTQEGRKAKGTVFLVTFKEGGQPSFRYAVTARHCIERSKSSQIFLRFNSLDGEVDDIPTLKSDWFTHDHADVAGIPYAPPQERDVIPIISPLFVNADYSYTGPVPFWPSNPWETDRKLRVQVGDDVYFVGLFVQSPGIRRALPIARFGAISRMPEELISMKRYPESDDETMFEQRAYLAECHSWGGHSGSPAVWIAPVYGTFRVPDLNKAFPIPAKSIQGLMGLVSGHFNIPVEAESQEGLGRIVSPINAGIAVITPGEYILELLEREDVVEDRKRRNQSANQSPPTMDMLPDSDRQFLAENEIAEEDFMDVSL